MGQRVGGSMKYNDAKSTARCEWALRPRELSISVAKTGFARLEYKKRRITK